MLNKDIRPPPVRGLTINMWAVAEFACIGIAATPLWSFFRALARARGFLQILAPYASAWYSLEREIAIWISMAAIGLLLPWQS